MLAHRDTTTLQRHPKRKLRVPLVLLALVATWLALGAGMPSPEGDPELRSLLNLPPHFPLPNIPDDNYPTAERIALGKKLFYDPILSRDSTVSCASCHHQSLAFADSVPKSFGIEHLMVDRNAPTLTNVAYQPILLSDAGVPTLEMQILVPVQEHREFDFNIVAAGKRVEQHPEYARLCAEAYPEKPSYFAITRAIACFERTLTSGSSPYDAYLQGDKKALSPAAKRGLKLFHKLECNACHSGLQFTNYSLANIGLYEHYADSGRARQTELAADRGAFKVPTLRNIALTAPYMHDGSLPTLEAVLAHKATGGLDHPNKSPLLKPFELSAKQQQDLLAFLHALTDVAFTVDPSFSAP